MSRVQLPLDQLAELWPNYRHEVGAIEIPDSDPGFYRGLLRP
jgi:hypothetical protein